MALATKGLLTVASTLLLAITLSAADPGIDLVELDTRKKSCQFGEVSLGVEGGRISDSQITSSSSWNSYLSTRQARLNGKASWSARRNDKNQWIQVDLGRQEIVTAIATQGRRNADQWVKSYSVSYSSNGKNFEYYKIKGIVMVFSANYERNPIVKNFLSPPVTARYVRIHPKTWYRHISMRIEVYGCTTGTCKSGEVALGMQNGRIKDSQLTASSIWNAALSTRQARMNGPTSWSVRHNNLNQWIQVDLRRTTVVTAIGTQGRNNHKQWVKAYTVSFSINGDTFKSYKINCAVKVFTGNRDRFSIVTNVLSPAISVRYLRIHPVSWYRHISMRFEVYGCYSGPCKLGETALGLENEEIKNWQLTASSVWGPALSTSQGRLDGPASWSARRNNQNQWFQVDLGRLEVVTAIGTQGRANYNQWVKTYSVSYSSNGKAFQPYAPNGRQKMFKGNSDRNSVVENVLLPTVAARYVRIHPKAWYRHISMRVEVYGCRREIVSLCKYAEVTLGVETGGRIPNSQITASSYWSTTLSPQKGRLYGIRSWSARRNNKNQWIQVDLGGKKFVTAVATQGRNNYNQWVKTYSVSYSSNGKTFESYKISGKVKLFHGNNDRNTIIKNALSSPVSARYIRIHPRSWYKHISMRIELYGCYKASGSPCDRSPCSNGATCIDLGSKFLCKCPPNFIGVTCSKELKNPCSRNPCRNGGVCIRLGNGYSCRCPPNFGGNQCQHSQSSCYAQGDPHYTSFDRRKFDFMGKCQYIFAQDCSKRKLFTVYTKNRACGRFGAACVDAVTVVLAGYKIQFNRVVRLAIINGAKHSSFPIVRPGFIIRNPSLRWLTLTADIGISVSWDCNAYIKVTVSGKFKSKLCSSSLCGNNNGNRRDDNQFDRRCAPPPGQLVCIPTAEKEPVIKKCHLMNAQGSPFKACNGIVDPTDLIANCKYDACRCKDAMKCVCSSFAAYSKQCAAHGKVVNWRFQVTYLYPSLKACAQQCKNEGEIFMECGLSCARSCQDLSRDIKCNEECVAGCQCPYGQLLNHKNRCVPVVQCSCQYEGKMIGPGESVDVGNCKTCTCNRGSMACIDDRDCKSKGPCESFPCKNNGVCKEDGDKFVCQCTTDYQGKTCEDLTPTPCDSKPCKNNGTCTNEGTSYSCECIDDYQGKTCEKVKCKNEKLDVLFVVDGSGSVQKKNFASVKSFIQKLNERFDIGAGKTQVALIQFGAPGKTRIEFNLGEKKTLKEVNQGVEEMNYLASWTATGDALRKSRAEVFNGKGNDRPDASNVLLLFTDGQASDSQGKDYQVEQAKKLKDDGVKVITVGMGQRNTINQFRDKLREMASRAGDTGEPLMFEADFNSLESIANALVKEACDDTFSVS